jgi:hypothetical protein
LPVYLSSFDSVLIGRDPLIPSSLAGRGGFGDRQNRGGVVRALDS